ncbi:MAG: hypothetical protein ACRENG_10445 [bacterium]
MAEMTLKDAKQMLKQIKAKARLKYSSKEFVRLGEKRYKEIKEQVEAKHKHKFVVIEVDSGDYFIDKDSVKATLKAEKKYPNTVFYLARIGYPAAFSMKGNIQLL